MWSHICHRWSAHELQIKHWSVASTCVLLKSNFTFQVLSVQVCSRDFAMPFLCIYICVCRESKHGTTDQAYLFRWWWVRRTAACSTAYQIGKKTHLWPWIFHNFSAFAANRYSYLACRWQAETFGVDSCNHVLGELHDADAVLASFLVYLVHQPHCWHHDTIMFYHIRFSFFSCHRT